jgi:hypothetical protein
MHAEDRELFFRQFLGNSSGFFLINNFFGGQLILFLSFSVLQRCPFETFKKVKLIFFVFKDLCLKSHLQFLLATPFLPFLLE